ncbi:MAG: hypothetical protein IPL52_01770 [Flavobacteriales bacterium]|nr:hypothetical protein [Flavobacteriales bacterium]
MLEKLEWLDAGSDQVTFPAGSLKVLLHRTGDRHKGREARIGITAAVHRIVRHHQAIPAIVEEAIHVGLDDALIHVPVDVLRASADVHMVHRVMQHAVTHAQVGQSIKAADIELVGEQWGHISAVGKEHVGQFVHLHSSALYRPDVVAIDRIA